MMKRFRIHRHPNFITAAQIQKRGAAQVFEPLWRFRTLNELADHFAAMGVPAYALEAAQQSISSTGRATLVYFDSQRGSVH